MISTMLRDDVIKTARLLYAKGIIEDGAVVYRDLPPIWPEDVDIFLKLAQVQPKDRYKYAKTLDQRRQKYRLQKHLKRVDSYAARFERYTEEELQTILEAVAIINRKSLGDGAFYNEFAILFNKIAHDKERAASRAA